MVSLLCYLFTLLHNGESKLVTGCDLKRNIIFCQLELGRGFDWMLLLSSGWKWYRHLFTLALMMTAAFSWNVDKVFFSKLGWYLPLQITACDTFYWASILQVTNTIVRRSRYEFYFFFVANTVFFISTLSSSHLSLQSLYQPPMFGRPKVCDQWGVWCILRLQITRWVFTGQGSDGLWQRWKDLPEPVPPRSNSVQQWNKYILQAHWKLSRYVFYPGEVHSSHWSWKLILGIILSV